MTNYIAYCLTFLVSFGIYLNTLFPSIAPYRDSGEMVSMIYKLGIAHPPGYPLYAVIGKIFVILLPWANLAYRLNVFSALFGALTVTLMVMTIVKLTNPIPSFGKGRSGWIWLCTVSGLVFATSYLQWYLSLVSEMYTLNTFFIMLTLYLISRNDAGKWGKVKGLYLLAFVIGLGLGNRLDLALTMVGIFVWWAVKLKEQNVSYTRLTQTVMMLMLFFFAGFSIYLYLMVRSGQNPMLDWYHPASLDRLFSVISRKSHGGTLDLVSERYAKGENFIPSMVFYFQHLWRGFAYVGVLIAVYGVTVLWRRNLAVALATIVSFMVAGPVFIYLGNMPPNPHSLAILEAHFLSPNLFVAIWLGVGLVESVAMIKQKMVIIVVIILVTLLPVLNYGLHYNNLNKRINYFDYDYGRNVLASVKKNSVVVLHEDVQLFSLWYHQFTHKRRLDTWVVAQGLAQSPWYQDQMKRWYPNIYPASDKSSLSNVDKEISAIAERQKKSPDDNNYRGGVYLDNLRQADTLKKFYDYYNNKRNIYFSVDTEVSGDVLGGLSLSNQGLVGLLSNQQFKPVPQTDILLSNFYIYRGKYQYQAYYEFFTPDLIEDYSKAHQYLAHAYMMNNDYRLAEKNFKISEYMQPEFPQLYTDMAYMLFSQNRLQDSINCYLKAVDSNKSYLKKAQQYRSYPEVVNSIINDLSNVLNNLGVMYEKAGNSDLALQQYEQAVYYNPSNIDAMYNISVVYWKQEKWDKVITVFENILRIDPQNQRARYYLNLAKNKMVVR